MRLDLAPVVQNYLVEQLKMASILRDTVDTNKEMHRGIGKSTALVKFAQEFGFTVIVPTHNLKNALIEETGYENIIHEREIGEQKIKSRFVHDEGVDLSRLKGLDVVTGFYKAY